MPVDFDKLVLEPSQRTFAISIFVNPVTSQPEVGIYAARAIWSKRPVDITTDNGAVLSSEERRLSIRLSEFLVPPVQNDQISYDNMETWHWVDDVDEDGQGAAALALREI